MTIPISIIGIDLGKNWFHVVGLDPKGTFLLRNSRPSVDSRHVSLRSCIASDDGGSRSTTRSTKRHEN